ncbi:hypothetical protein PG997_009784 [Apiospora hydei]|uniref:Uncharacterized protein n=1 Tax=Apiospora hydei TaxID=1337664 RepID=A0ABR1VV47_9PEZI
MHFVTSSVVMAGLAVANAAQPAPRITPAPALVNRQDWQNARDSALAAASSAAALASSIDAEFNKRGFFDSDGALFGASMAKAQASAAVAGASIAKAQASAFASLFSDDDDRDEKREVAERSWEDARDAALSAASVAQAEASKLAEQFQKREVADRSWEDTRDAALSAASVAQAEASKIAEQFEKRDWQQEVSVALAKASSWENGEP